jgi:hypothetical protein
MAIVPMKAKNRVIDGNRFADLLRASTTETGVRDGPHNANWRLAPAMVNSQTGAPAAQAVA